MSKCGSDLTRSSTAFTCSKKGSNCPRGSALGPSHKALCDGPSALPLGQLEPFLEQVKAVDDLVKSLPHLDID